MTARDGLPAPQDGGDLESELHICSDAQKRRGSNQNDSIVGFRLQAVVDVPQGAQESGPPLLQCIARKRAIGSC